MDWIIAAVIILLGAALTLRRSSWSVDYLIIVFVFNRGLRRILDWNAGEFNPFSPISLTPLILAGLMFLPLAGGLHSLPPAMRRIFYCFGGALTYAFVLGFLRVHVAALYALAEFASPVALFGFAVTTRYPQPVRDRWIKTMSWCAVLASVYGWYQYLTIPPWDAFWVRSVGFEGYLGQLRPKEMSVFSTMHERGPLAGYLGLAAVAMVVSSRWRTFLSWPAVILVLSCILLTFARAGLIFAGIGVLSFVLVNRGASLGRIVGALLAIVVVAPTILNRLPGNERIQKRFESLRHMEQDGSFKGRMEIYSQTMMTVLTHPVGYGMGATGYASRINSGEMSADEGEEAVVGDAGYAELFLTYGWFGTGLFVAGILGIWTQMGRRYRAGNREPGLLLGRALMVGLIPMFAVGNMLNGVSLFWLSFGVALAPLPKARRRGLRLEEEAERTSIQPSPSPSPA